MADEHEAAPAGWYPDPAARYSERYWDGSAWTDQAFDHNFSGQDPEGAPTAPPPRARERDIPEAKPRRRPMQVERWFLPAFVAFVCLLLVASAGYTGLRHFTHHSAKHAAGAGLRARVKRAEEAVIPPSLPTTTTTTLPVTGATAEAASAAAKGGKTTTTLPRSDMCVRGAKRSETDKLLCSATRPHAHGKGR